MLKALCDCEHDLSDRMVLIACNQGLFSPNLFDVNGSTEPSSLWFHHFLPPASEVCGKVMFQVVSVSFSVKGVPTYSLEEPPP